MGAVVSDDLKLSAAAGELWESRDLQDFRRRILTVMRGLIAADIASYNEICSDVPDAVVVAEPDGSLGSFTPERVERFAQVINQNPMANYYLRTGDSRALRMSDFISRRGLHALELWDSYYRPIGTEYQIAFSVPAGNSLVGVTLSRSTRDFDDSERELLERVRLLVEPVYRGLFDRARLQAVMAALDAGADHEGRTPLAILLVLPGGALQAAHGQAERLLGELSADPVAGGELRAWAALRRSARRPGEPLLVQTGRRELRARYVYAGAGGFDAISLHASERPALAALRELGLTARQAGVLQLVWAGAPNDQIALALSISEHTVRHHLEEIYRRLGVGSRAGAAHAATEALQRWG